MADSTFEFSHGEVGLTRFPPNVEQITVEPVVLDWDSRRLWSLWDMIKIDIRPYVRLGTKIRDAQSNFWLVEDEIKGGPLSGGAKTKTIEELDTSDKAELEKTLSEMREICRELRLSTSRSLLAHAIKDLPQTEREFLLLRRAMMAELRNTLFLFVPNHRARYYEYDNVLNERAREAFPSAYIELRSAGNAYATALHTACIFHAMRAAEIGLRTLGTTLGVAFPFPIVLADWQNIIDQIEAKIRDLDKLPKTAERDDKIGFYAQAAAQFRYFKGAWRIRVSHARETYDEQQAIVVLRHTREFLEWLSQRIREDAVEFTSSSEPLGRPADDAAGAQPA